tara:strand:+ start:400 stop:669 length:270 start_codon:yes stop_codon:yes gene_type:complete
LEAVVAAVLVFITTGILFFLLEGGFYIERHPCRLTTLVMGVVPIFVSWQKFTHEMIEKVEGMSLLAKGTFSTGGYPIWTTPSDGRRRII